MKNYPHKRSIVVLLLVFVPTFFCGAAVRSNIQDGGPIWLDGAVGMIMGLGFGLLGSADVLAVYDSWHLHDRGRLYNATGFIFGIVAITAGIGVFVSGLTKLINSIPL
ncbi:MAG TPA: hypothetical protein VMP08_02170 [Anaerolineae bacterium]|nr:hypothetical protein [Anaerolineae bacterium]